MSTGMELQPYNVNCYRSNPMFMGMNNESGDALYNRWQKSFNADMHSMYSEANIHQSVANNPQAMEALTEELVDANGLLKRAFNIEREQLPTLLNGHDTAKTVGLVRRYGESKGDAAALIKDTESFWTFGNAENQNNHNLDLIVKATIDTKDPHTAALLVLESADGLGNNTSLLNKLLIESKENMEEAEYNRFISETAEKFKEFSGGESMTEFLKSNYANGFRAFGLNWFGTDDAGEHLINTVIKAIKSNEGGSHHSGNSGHAVAANPAAPMAMGMGMYGMGNDLLSCMAMKGY